MKFENKHFVHWHVHSMFSQFDGLADIHYLVHTARKMGFPAFAISDHGSIMGWIKFLKECRATKDKKGEDISYPPIKPILGCLLKGQLIITKNGVKPIEDIKIGDMVLTHRGRFKRVISISNRKYSGTLFKIKLSKTDQELCLTEEHPILIRKYEGDIKWQTPDKILFGRINKRLGVNRWHSWVCLPKLEQIDNISIKVEDYLPDNMGSINGHIKKIKKKNKYDNLTEWKNIPDFIPLDKEMAYFLGLFVADGSVSVKNGKINGYVVLTFNKNEQNYADFVVSFLQKRFGIYAKNKIRIEKGSRDVRFCCLPLAYLLAGMCGVKSYNKKIPSIIYSVNREIKEFFLDGLLDGDGKSFESVSNKISQSRYFKVSSQDLAWGFRQLIADLGFWGRVSKRKVKIYKNRTSYSYGVSFNPFRSYSRTMEDEKFVYKPIFNILKNKIENVDVYNIGVEDDHSYVSDFVLHNCEMYLAKEMNIGQYDEALKKKGEPKRRQPDGRRGNRHLNVFAMNFEGYKNICTLSQLSFTDGFYSDPRIDIDILSKYSKGVMGSSACLSNIINVNLLHGRYKEAKMACGIFNEVFEGNFFLEAMYHGIPEEEAILPSIFKLSKELRIPVICTNDSHYICKPEGSSQEILLCMSQGKCIKDPKRLQFSYMEFYLKSAQEMAEIFGDHPECFTNSLLMAERIDTKDIEKKLFGGMRLPAYEIPKEYKDPYDYVYKLAWDGLKKIGWDQSKDHVNALKRELEDVRVAKENNNYDFSTYFLIVRDYIREARRKGVLIGPGRGSGYSSILLRCLGITYGVDPLKHNLIWERFLGFSNKRFIKSSDFGFEEDIVQQTLIVEQDDLEEDRELEDDLGGIDRY